MYPIWNDTECSDDHDPRAPREQAQPPSAALACQQTLLHEAQARKLLGDGSSGTPHTEPFMCFLESLCGMPEEAAAADSCSRQFAMGCAE